MSGGYSAKLQRIIKSDERSRRWVKRALKQLNAEFGARQIQRSKRPVAVELESGTIVCRKKSFKTRERAEQSLQQISLVGGLTTKTPCRVYECSACRKWHLTSRGTGYETPAYEEEPNV
jgi:hypothetical protein